MTTTDNAAAPEEEQTPQPEETTDAQQEGLEEPQLSEPVTQAEFLKANKELMNQLRRTQGVNTKGLDTLEKKILRQSESHVRSVLASMSAQRQFEQDLAAVEDPDARSRMERWRPKNQETEQPEPETDAAKEKLREYVGKMGLDPENPEIDYAKMLNDGANPTMDQWAEFNTDIRHLIDKQGSAEQPEQEQESQPQQTKSPPSQAGPDRSQSISSVDQLWDAYTDNRIDLDAFKEKHKKMTGRDP
tara:strand:+ start:89 stop:823 length:735 start_codon:yes stop_codon:yes gene_type:complete